MLPNPFVDELGSAFGIFADVAFFEPDESHSQLFERSLPVLIGGRFEVMGASVNFHSEFQFRTVEVNNPVGNWDLAVKVIAQPLPAFQQLPEQDFPKGAVVT